MSPTDAILLNNIVQNFGMLDLVKKVLAGHKCQMDRSREQYARDLAGVWGSVPSCPLPSPRTAAPVSVRQGPRPGGHPVLSPVVMLRLPQEDSHLPCMSVTHLLVSLGESSGKGHRDPRAHSKGVRMGQATPGCWVATL